MKITVLYKDYDNWDNSLPRFVKDEFKCWDEQGSYTFLYKEYESGKENFVDICIPTIHICWIKPVRE